MVSQSVVDSEQGRAQLLVAAWVSRLVAMKVEVMARQ